MSVKRPGSRWSALSPTRWGMQARNEKRVEDNALHHGP